MFRVWFRAPIIKNHMEKKMENYMDIGIICGDNTDNCQTRYRI